MTDTCNDAPPGCVISTVATVGIDAVLSGDGRFAVFANLVNVYEQDTCLGPSAPSNCVPQSTLISSDNTNTSHYAIQPAVSEDGRFVAFTTDVNIDPSDVNGLNDVYLRDTCNWGYVVHTCNHAYFASRGLGCRRSAGRWP